MASKTKNLGKQNALNPPSADEKYKASIARLKGFGATNSSNQLPISTSPIVDPNKLSKPQLFAQQNSTPPSEVDGFRRESIRSTDLDEVKINFREQLVEHKQNILLWVVGTIIAASLTVGVAIWAVVSAQISEAKNDFREIIKDYRDSIRIETDRFSNQTQKEVDKFYDNLKEQERRINKIENLQQKSSKK